VQTILSGCRLLPRRDSCVEGKGADYFRKWQTILFSVCSPEDRVQTISPRLELYNTICQTGWGIVCTLASAIVSGPRCQTGPPPGRPHRITKRQKARDESISPVPRIPSVGSCAGRLSLFLEGATVSRSLDKFPGEHRRLKKQVSAFGHNIFYTSSFSVSSVLRAFASFLRSFEPALAVAPPGALFSTRSRRACLPRERPSRSSSSGGEPLPPCGLQLLQPVHVGPAKPLHVVLLVGVLNKLLVRRLDPPLLVFRPWPWLLPAALEDFLKNTAPRRRQLSFAPV
jgi:hypothetical protein